MKKYKLLNPLILKSGTSDYLLLPGDEIWAELRGTSYYVYSPKTRRKLGYSARDTFITNVQES